MKKVTVQILLFFALVPFTALTQTTNPDALLNQMTGNWVLRGTIGGQQIIHDVTTSWVLGHKYLQLKEVSRDKDKIGKPSYEAHVYICWDQPINQYSCLWLDNSGSGGLNSKAVGHANLDDNKLEFIFKHNDEVILHTIFVYNAPAKNWQWQINGEKDGQMQPFADLKLTRE